MLRYDEELRGPSHRTKGQIKVKEHPRMGRLNCSILDLCYKQLTK